MVLCSVTSVLKTQYFLNYKLVILFLMRNMYPPCETVARYVLPVFRSFVAKELVEKYGFTQVEAAKRLGTTQAAISQYLHSKRGYGGADQFRNALPRIRESASETARRIVAENMSSDELRVAFCDLCMRLQRTT
jgi:predicted transcriptional regulator